MKGPQFFSSGVKCAIGSDQKCCEALLQFDLQMQSTACRWICFCADSLILWLMGNAEFSSLVLNLWHVGLSNSDLQLGNHNMNETYVLNENFNRNELCCAKGGNYVHEWDLPCM